MKTLLYFISLLLLAGCATVTPESPNLGDDPTMETPADPDEVLRPMYPGGDDDEMNGPPEMEEAEEEEEEEAEGEEEEDEEGTLGTGGGPSDPAMESEPEPGPDGRLSLPDASEVVRALAEERPELLARACVDRGGDNDFLFELVRRLRVEDLRWGLNWKRGIEGELSQDVVNYFWAEDGPSEGRTEVYIVRVITDYCPDGGDPPPAPAWLDLTQATADADTIGRWTIAPLDGVDPNPEPAPEPDPGVRRPLPDEYRIVEQLGAERPDLLARSCVEQGGDNAFLFELVRRLRAVDSRWGLNWKRGNVGDLSQDVVDYYYGSGEPTEGSAEVYIIDVISGHCPRPGDPPSGTTWIDQTEETARGGTIGRWTLDPLP